MRILALYLPQYHSFPENDAWWGKGYTEWTAVKRAKPLFKGHHQPVEPLDGYYDLVDEGVKTWTRQAELAQKYGVDGFAVYQYWFKGKMLMHRPLEILLEHPEIDINYCITWANETWTRTWYGLEEEVLMKQEYGNEADWEKHFSYCLKFFKDKRYIKIDDKPLFNIYRTFDIDCLSGMTDYFNKRAREEGFAGIFFVGGNTAGQTETRKELLDAFYDFEPGRTLKHNFSRIYMTRYELATAFRHGLNLLVKKKILERRIPIKWIIDNIVKRDYEENEFPGLIARWDNTPRRDYKGLVYTGASPELFGAALRALSEKVKGRKNDFVYINAWNEWGEGAMLEPTVEEEYAYLEEIKKVKDL